MERLLSAEKAFVHERRHLYEACTIMAHLRRKLSFPKNTPLPPEAEWMAHLAHGEDSFEALPTGTLGLSCPQEKRTLPVAALFLNGNTWEVSSYLRSVLYKQRVALLQEEAEVAQSDYTWRTREFLRWRKTQEQALARAAKQQRVRQEGLVEKEGQREGAEKRYRKWLEEQQKNESGDGKA